MIEKKIKLANLYDFYGELLTDKQKGILDLYCIHDLSLGEISEELTISRQAVYDTIKRVEVTLDNYEAKLNLFARFYESKDKAKALLDEIQMLSENEKVNSDEFLSMEIRKLRQMAENIMD